MSKQWPECEEFYSLMQRYRHLPVTWQQEVISVYEEIKEWLRKTKEDHMKVINCRTLGELCEHMLDGEPVFIFRAQDQCSVKALHEYLRIIQEDGGKNTIRTEEDIQRFIAWRDTHPSRVKLPD